MRASTARSMAFRVHAGQLDRQGLPLLGHLTRVAAAVPVDAKATAWLHDSIERAATTMRELSEAGLSRLERQALELLTHYPSDSYELYVLRIAFADGAAGRLARVVKLADLDDNLAYDPSPDAPPYAWARRRIAIGGAHRAAVELKVLPANDPEPARPASSAA